MMAAVAVGGFAKSPKRGVSENNFSMGAQLEALEPGVCWYYNWGNTPGAGYQDQVINFEGMEFVPMCWNGNFNADRIREYCKTHPQTKHLLGFNEPNFLQQANMTPEQAAEKWPEVQALAKELGLKLVAPALNYSPNPPYTDPLRWMDEFVKLVGLDAFDYTAIHNYGGLNVMIDLATKFHDRYGKDVWVTEFCYWPNEGNGNDYVSPEVQTQSMVSTLEWLETTEWIYRYAWFKAVGASNGSGPNYGLLVHEGSIDDPWDLSQQGAVYVHMGDFRSVHNVSETIPAADYVKSNGVLLDKTASFRNPSMIEISRFASGAEATWRFNVPEAGDYYVTLELTGYGEPTRFDPTLQWLIVEGGQERALTAGEQFSLPNSETQYEMKTFEVTLPAGEVELKLKDAGPYAPSGIRIATLRLDDKAAVGEILDDETAAVKGVYNLQGVKVGETLEGLPKGIYISGGRKVVRM